MGDSPEDLHGPDYCGEHFECPICGFSHCPAEPKSCPHLLATIEPCNFIDVPRGIPDFSEAVIAFIRGAEDIDLKNESRTVLRTAPEGLKALICLAAEEGESQAPSYWIAYYDDILTVYWEVTDSPMGGAGYHCFHPAPEAFAQKIKSDAVQALAWVIEYLKAKYEQEESRNRYLYDDEHDNFEDDEEANWR